MRNTTNDAMADFLDSGATCDPREVGIRCDQPNPWQQPIEGTEAHLQPYGHCVHFAIGHCCCHCEQREHG